MSDLPQPWRQIGHAEVLEIIANEEVGGRGKDWSNVDTPAPSKSAGGKRPESHP
jgi:hypothetical protein